MPCTKKYSYIIYMFTYHGPVKKITSMENKNAHPCDKNNSKIVLQNTISECVITNLFSNDDSREIIFEMLAYVEAWTFLHTNIKLIDSGHLPLIGDETLNLVCKGSTALNIYLAENVTNTVTEPFDFSLIIKTNKANRFEIIEQFATESLVEIFNLLSAKFDLLFDFSDKPDIFDSLLNISNINHDLKLTININEKRTIVIKELMDRAYFNVSMNALLSKTNVNTQYFGERNISLYKNVINELHTLNKFDDDINIFPYIYYFNQLMNPYVKSSTLAEGVIDSSFFVQKNSDFDIFNNTILNLINKCFAKLGNLKIYSSHNRESLMNDLKSKLNNSHIYYSPIYDIDTNESEQNNDIFFNKIKFSNNSNIAITPTYSTYLYFDDTKLINKNIFDSARKHIVSIDQTKIHINRCKSNIIDFDLVRLQLSFTINNCIINDKLASINIPAKFIDINIIRFRSTMYDVVCKLSETESKIKIYDIDALIKLYMQNLFDSYHFFPWHDVDYYVKLYKVLLLISYENREMINILHNVLTTDNMQNIINYKIFLDFDYKSCSFYDLIIFDNKTSNKYRHVIYPLKLIILMNEISNIKSEPNTIFKYFYTNYGWLWNDDMVSEIASMFTSFKHKLLEIVNDI